MTYLCAFMQHSKLIELLQILTLPEQRDLLAWLSGEVERSTQKTIVLGACLLRYVVPLLYKQQTVDLTKETVFIAVFGRNQPFDATKLATAATHALKITEHFIAIALYAEKDATAQARALTDFYEQRQLPKQWAVALRQTEQLLAQQQQNSQATTIPYCYDAYLCAIRYQNYHTANENEAEKNRYSLQAIYHAELLYVLAGMQHYCDHLNGLMSRQAKENAANNHAQKSVDAVSDISREWANDNQFALFGALLPQVVQRYNQLPTVRVFYAAIQMLQQPDNDAAFQTYKTALFEHIQQLPQGAALNLCIYGLNCCTRRRQQGDTHYDKEHISILRLQLDTEGVGASIRPVRFKTLVSNLLDRLPLEEIERFIGEYIGKVSPAFRQEVYDFNMAVLSFRRGDYKRVLQLLRDDSNGVGQRVKKFAFVGYQIVARRLLIKAAYELDEDTDDLLNNLAVFIALNKTDIADRIVQRNRHFIKWLKKIIALPPDKRSAKVRRNTLAQQIAAEPLLSDKRWLLDKLAGQ